MGKLRHKELSGFEDLLGLLELLQLSFRLLEFLFFCKSVVVQAVDLVEHDFDCGFLLTFCRCRRSILISKSTNYPFN